MTIVHLAEGLHHICLGAVEGERPIGPLRMYGIHIALASGLQWVNVYWLTMTDNSSASTNFVNGLVGATPIASFRPAQTHSPLGNTK